MLSAKSVQRARVKLKLPKTVKQSNTAEDVLPAIMEIKEEFPAMGGRTLTNTLRIEKGIRLSECVSFDLRFAF